jgi:hypothetical protein
MTTYDGERKAIEEARGALSTLTPSRLSTLHDDPIAFAVRHAYRLMDNDQPAPTRHPQKGRPNEGIGRLLGQFTDGGTAFAVTNVEKSQ